MYLPKTYELPEVEAKIIDINKEELLGLLHHLWATVQESKTLIAIWLEHNNPTDDYLVNFEIDNSWIKINIWWSEFFSENTHDVLHFFSKLKFIWWSIWDKVSHLNLNWRKTSKFRVRLEWNTTMVEIKEKGQWINWKWKVANEVWFSSNDFESIIKWFTNVWFQEISKSVKERISCLLELDSWAKAEIVFDTYSQIEWKSIPTLLEIECMKLPDNFVLVEWKDINQQLVEAAYEIIVEVALLLWFSKENLLDWDARELASHY